MSQRKADITELDWYLLKQRVRFAEYAIVHQSPVSLAGDYEYDGKADSVHVNANVNPDWYVRTNADGVSEELKSDGAVICLPLATFMGPNFLRKCTVEFTILLVDKQGQTQKRTATFENGKLYLP